MRVSAEGPIGCGFCGPCRTGNGHVCEKVDIIGIDIDGCFAQFPSVPEEKVWPVHPDIPDHLAAILDRASAHSVVSRVSDRQGGCIGATVAPISSGHRAPKSSWRRVTARERPRGA